MPKQKVRIQGKGQSQGIKLGQGHTGVPVSSSGRSSESYEAARSAKRARVSKKYTGADAK